MTVVKKALHCTALTVLLIAGMTASRAQITPPALNETPAQRAARLMSEATRIKAELKAIRNVRASRCIEGTSLNAGSVEAPLSPELDIVAGRTSLHVTGPRMDRIQRAVLWVGDRPRVVSIFKRLAPGACGAGSVLTSGRDGTAELRFTTPTGGRIRSARLQLFARDGSTLAGVPITSANAACAPNCDLQNGAPMAADIAVRIYPRPKFSSVSSYRVAANVTPTTANVVFDRGAGLAEPAPILISGFGIRDPAQLLTERSATRVRATFTVDLPCNSEQHTVRPALKLRGANGAFRRVTANDTQNPDEPRTEFEGVTMEFDQLGCPSSGSSSGGGGGGGGTTVENGPVKPNLMPALSTPVVLTEPLDGDVNSPAPGNRLVNPFFCSGLSVNTPTTVNVPDLVWGVSGSDIETANVAFDVELRNSDSGVVLDTLHLPQGFPANTPLVTTKNYPGRATAIRVVLNPTVQGQTRVGCFTVPDSTQALDPINLLIRVDPSDAIDEEPKEDDNDLPF